MQYKLFQPTYTDRKTGESRQSDTYHVRFRDHLNRRQTIAGYTRESDTHTLAVKVMELVRCRRNSEMPGDKLRKWIITLPEKISTRLTEMDLIERRAMEMDRLLIEKLEGVTDADGKVVYAGWKQALSARGNTTGHVNSVVRRVKHCLSECGFMVWRDLAQDNAAVKVEVWLGGRRDKGEITGTEYNYVVRDLKSFCRWLHKHGGAPDVAMIHLAKVENAEADAEKRRALSADEMRWLLDITVNGRSVEGKTVPSPVFLDMTGEQRAMLYRFGFETGMRPGQIRSLKVSDFKLDAQPATVTTQAKYVKRRRVHTQTLRPEMTGILREMFKSKLPAAEAIKMPSRHRMAKMLRRDLAEARAAWIDAASTPDEREKRQRSDFLADTNHAGERAVFYSLRHAHGTALAEMGVPEAVVAASMHHASRTTTARYIHPGRKSLADAIASLPDMPYPQKQVATGTHGPDPDVCLRNACATGKTPVDSSGESGAGEGEAQPSTNAEEAIKSAGNQRSASWRNWQTRRIQNPLTPPQNPREKQHKAPSDPACLRNACADADLTEVSDPELVEIVRAWGSLSDDVRRTILGVVRLSGKR